MWGQPLYRDVVCSDDSTSYGYPTDYVIYSAVSFAGELSYNKMHLIISDMKHYAILRFLLTRIEECFYHGDE